MAAAVKPLQQIYFHTVTKSSETNLAKVMNNSEAT
jgi:hypothetical protein